MHLYVNHARGIWNLFLSKEKEYYEREKRFLWKNDLQKLHTRLVSQEEYKWLSEIPRQSSTLVCQNLSNAIQFATGKKKIQGREFPTYKKKNPNSGSFQVFGSKSGFYASDPDHVLTLPKIGKVKTRGRRHFPGAVYQRCTVFRDGDRWYASLSYDAPDLPEPEETDRVVAVDMGIKALVTTYDGNSFKQILAPKFARKSQKRLTLRQRRLARKQKDSKRRAKQVLRVRAVYRKIRNQRKDLAHQITHRLTTKVDVLRIESLRPRAIARGGKGRRGAGIRYAAHDASMSLILSQLEYKCARRHVILDRVPWNFPSTKQCASCGTKHEMPLSKRVMQCDCGFRLDRDANAALNIYWYGEERRNHRHLSGTLVETVKPAELALLGETGVEARTSVRTEDSSAIALACASVI